MKVTILGSGTAIPVPDRLPSGVLVTAADQVILIDLGPGVLRQLAKLGFGPDQITAVLLTHYHTDHTADLAALLFALRNPQFKGRPPLTILGHTGLHTLLSDLTQAWPWLAPNGYDLDVREIAPGSFRLGEIEVMAVAIEHTAASLAYRITDPKGHSVALSGDADECDGLSDVAAGTDLFICEAAFPDGQKVSGHITPSIAGAAAQAANAKALCMTHFYPECEGADLLAQARKTYDGEVFLAQDLMEFDLSDDSWRK